MQMFLRKVSYAHEFLSYWCPNLYISVWRSTLHLHLAYRQSIIFCMISNLFFMEKLTKLVSISTWYGGPSCVLYWKKRADEVCGLQQKWDTKLLQYLFCPTQYLVQTYECNYHFNIYSILNHVPNVQGRIIINIW